MKSIREIFKENNLVLAPLAKVHNRAFRLLCRKHGAGLLYTDMIVIPQIINNFSRLETFFENCEKDFPIAVQLIGNEKDDYKKTMDHLNSYKFFIDLNLGCPSHKFRNQQKGGFLLKKPKSIKEIAKRLIKYCDNPVSAKIRTGFDSSNVNALEVARILETEGIEFLAIHGRTVKQQYKPGIDYNTNRKIKENISIPVIGNGDIKDGPSTIKMLNETSCDALMIGRGCIGNPRVFIKVKQYLESETELITDLSTTKQIIIEFHDLLKKHENEKLKLNELNTIKYFALHALKGYPHSKKWRMDISKIKNLEKLLDYINESI